MTAASPPPGPVSAFQKDFAMKHRHLGSLDVSALGLGCMGMSHAYGATHDEAAAIATLHRAVDLGITLFDTAEVYGPYANEILVGKALKPVRDKVAIATKFGFRIDPSRPSAEMITGTDSRPENVRAVAEASLKRLGVEVIDLYYLHRPDTTVPIEDTVGAMARLVEQGKVRRLGLSEAAPATIRRAHAVHPIAALQTELSLWSRDPERELLPLCEELGIAFVAYSPLGRGFLTGTMRSTEALAPSDFRRRAPRLQGENLAKNLALVDGIGQVAEARGVTPAQLALAWVLSRGRHVIAIPGTE